MRVDRENPNKYFDESDASYEARRIWYAFKDVGCTNISMMTYILLSIIISQKTYQIAFCNIKFCRISILNPYRQK